MNSSSVALPWRCEGDPPVHTGACVNIRHRGAGCARCADACPAEAITPGPTGPVLDAEACVRCGVCVPACPTDALELGGSLRVLRDAIADAPREDAVTVCCPRGGEQASTPTVLGHDRCLAALGGGELLVLAMSRGGRLRLDDTPCGGCPLALHATVVTAAHRANCTGAAFGLPVRIVLETSEPSSGPVLRSRTVDAGHAAVSRRGLFRKVAGTTIDRAPDDHADHLPPTRRRLLQHVRAASHGAPSARAESDLGFGDVVVDPGRCSACGLCAQLCPTEALTFDITAAPAGTTREATFELDAHPDRCVACDLCTTACPEDAVTVRRSLDPSAVLHGAAVHLLSGPVAACEVCGAVTRSGDGGDARCFACRPGVVSPLRDERGLMSDLLGRARA
jgi:ferredoxin